MKALKTLKLIIAAVVATTVSSTTVSTPVFAHSDNECIKDVHEFCGDSDDRCKKAGRLACLHHHASGGIPPPPPDPAYSTPDAGPSFSNSGPKLKAN
jgi:hypothetical protein